MVIGNSVALKPGPCGTTMRGFTLWLVKLLALWVVLLLGSVFAGMLVPVDLPPPAADGPLTTGQALLVVDGLMAIALAMVAGRARQRGVRLGGLLFVASFVISTAMMQLETLWFNESLHLPLLVIGEITLVNAIQAVLVAIAGALLFRSVPEESDPLPATLLRRVVIMAFLYVLLYYTAGFFIAWQSAAVRAYYENGAHVPFLPTVAFQIFRGTLWALIALYIVSRMRGSLLSRALIMGVLFSVMTAAQLLFPTFFFPWSVRSAHLVEVGISEFAYGIIATLVLLSGAAKRPLSQTSPWHLIAGQA